MVDLGGGGTKQQVLDTIEKKSWIKLTPYDQETMESRKEIRWRNDLAFIRKHLVTSGYVSDQKWGEWHITEKGTEYFGRLCRQVQGSKSQRLTDLALLRLSSHISFSSAMLSDENAVTGETEFREGGKVLRWTTRYERDPGIRESAIKAHGTICMGCGFSFEQTYGVIGRGFIEVHHTRPVSTLEADTIVTPEQDMITLCSNCHSMVHRKKSEPLSLENLKAVLSQYAGRNKAV
jgi:hypothetical protein